MGEESNRRNVASDGDDDRPLDPELLEFLGDDESGPVPDPVFRVRLRNQLWHLVERLYGPAGSRDAEAPATAKSQRR